MEDPLLNPIGGGPVAPRDEDLGPFDPPPIGLETDPFYAFRDELAHTTRRSLARVEKIKLLTSSDEVCNEVASLRQMLASLRENVSHLERLVTHVEKKRADFSHLTDEDIKSRRTFLNTIQSRLKQVEMDLSVSESQAMEMSKEESRQRKQAQEQAKAAKSATISPIKTVRDEEDDADSLRYTHQQMLKEQDPLIDELSSSLGRLHEMGTDMYHEIDSQNKLLDVVNDEAVGLQGKMDGALGRLDKYLHTSSRGQTVSILFLVMVLLIEIIILSVI